ncbi:MAG: radical SAM protein [Oscillospiraceae bacterium]|nr:radical SAM protein [Oscillospiraceae bacterium]
MNKYLKNLKKIEFVITYACTGSCKHCSEGAHKQSGEHIAPNIAADAVRKTAKLHPITTVMTFGGEPLLYPESVFTIHKAAAELNIPKRQVITNGYFSKDGEQIRKIAAQLAESGVNDLLLSVDAFHQETIPIETVKCFAMAAKNAGVPIRTQPAWLVSPKADNPYNRKTKAILEEFAKLGITENEGNIIFPKGSALIYLKEYFKGEIAEDPYREDPKNVTCASVSPNGDVLGGNVYRQDMAEILERYTPELYIE